MSVNGITGSVANTSSTYATSSVKTDTTKAAGTAAGSSEQAAAVYEKSSSQKSGTYKMDADAVAKLKEASEAHVRQLEDIVNKLINKQGQTFSLATGKNLKSFFENLEVDAATKEQAQKDIAEDGYWGVTQTSQRIFDFAKALSGGDPDKMEQMRAAFEKGFKQATAAWGDELPEISQKTYGAVQSLFDNYKNEMENAAATTTN